ncbi:MAG TPA: hypothetical protein VNZ85_15370 [Caulobacter sp.]|nr:hypothetical protein [Caulobacter sp.]
MSKTKTAAVHILTGDAAITTTAPIKDPRFGAMLPGPAYDAYVSLRDFQTALEALVHGMEGFDIAKTEALERITALQSNPHTDAGSIKEYLSELRAALDAPKTSLDLSSAAKVAQALMRIREYLSPLSFGVSGLASAVPRPIDPNAPKRPEGQRLGTGLRDLYA